MAGPDMPERSAGAPRRAWLRGAAGLLALGATSACGFRPVYSGGGAAAGDQGVAEELAATRVPVIPDRFGQLLRRGLQQRLGQGGPSGVPAKWELLVGPAFSAEAVGIQRDGSASRVRTIATANWTLVRLSPREVVANGFERAIDAFNIELNQYFAAEASREAMERRLAEQLAEEVVIRLAIQMRTLREGGSAQRIEPVQPITPMPEPAPMLPPGAVPLPAEGLPGGPTGGIGLRDGFR